MNLVKPVRQGQRERKTMVKNSNSDRNGLKSAKNAQRQSSKETFDDFVIRMKKEASKSSENQYGTRIRPYTSSGYGQLRIKHQKRPITKSGLGLKQYENTRHYPYYNNRAHLPNQLRKRSGNRQLDYKSANLLNDSDSKKLNHRCTFYQGSTESLVNKTAPSEDIVLDNPPIHTQNTYFNKKVKYISCAILIVSIGFEGKSEPDK